MALLNLKKSQGELKAAFTNGYHEFDQIVRLVDETCHTDAIGRLNDLLCYLDDRYQRIGFLGSLHVAKESRGQGVGAALMREFMAKVSPKTEVDLVIAEISNPQRKGFDLQTFYESFGFEPVCGIGNKLLMATKDQADELREILFMS